VLVDGLVQATWAARRDGAAMALAVRPSLPLAGPERAAVLDEGARLLGFLAPEREHDVGFVGR
jgi:hypothetical protein